MRTYPDWVHHELLNWARFCWDGDYPHPLPEGRCASVESRYVAPSDIDRDESRASRVEPNAKNAAVVQGVYEGLPLIQKLVLRAEYPQRHESGRVDFGMAGAARKLKMTIRDYECALFSAAEKVWNAFEKRGNR